MQRFFERLSEMMVAATFAEAGEWRTAVEILPPARERRGREGWFERVFMAVAFAEAGMQEEAGRIAGSHTPSKEPWSLGDLGLGGVHMAFGTVVLDACE